MSNEVLDYSLAIEKATANLETWSRFAPDSVDREDLYNVVATATEAVEASDELPNTLLAVEDVFACWEAMRKGIDWRAGYCRLERAEELDPVQVARSNHYAAVDQVGSFNNIHESLSSYYENMRDTLRWGGYGTVTIKLAEAEWDKLELARLTRLVNG